MFYGFFSKSVFWIIFFCFNSCIAASFFCGVQYFGEKEKWSGISGSPPMVYDFNRWDESVEGNDEALFFLISLKGENDVAILRHEFILESIAFNIRAYLALSIWSFFLSVVFLCLYLKVKIYQVNHSA